MITDKNILINKSLLIISIFFITNEFSFAQTDSTELQQLSPVKFGEFDVTIQKEVLPVKSNKLPIVNFEINTVSGGEFTAPVWVKFYPSGTYDPDGYILLFEMDMDGDGTFEVSENTLSGGSYEFTVPGNYTTTVRVTDDNGGITTKSKSFVITDSQNTYTEPAEVDQQVEDRKPEDIIVDDKLDSIVEEYKYQKDEPTTVNADKLIYQQVEERKPEDVELDRRLDSIIEEFKYQDEQPNTILKESEIVHQEPIIKEGKSTELILKSEQISEEKMDDLEYDVIEPSKTEEVYPGINKFEKVDQIDNQIYPTADAYICLFIPELE